MPEANKAFRIQLFSLRTPHMRAFHMAWLAFFLCFCGWFAVAPLMAIIREDLSLSKQQIGNTIIASVAGTVFARLLIGWLCDRVGPRRLFSALLIAGSLPVMAVGLADSYESFLLARLAIGMVGGSFVIAQYHTTLMFAPNCVGTANATTAGWGNMGGGLTQVVMPAAVGGFLALGLTQSLSWRLSMLVPGIAMIAAGFAYYRNTRDTAEGDFKELRAAGRMKPAPKGSGSWGTVLRDPRVWVLFLAYGACFGVELTTYNVTALYFTDRFGLSLQGAGLVAALHGSLNLFARALGGILGDRAGIRRGLPGRVLVLGAVLLAEGAALVLFSQMSALGPAIVALMVFSLFVQMACGATYSVVPFVNKRAAGTVFGIVGAGGNAGAVLAGFLFRSPTLSTQDALLWLGLAVLMSAGLAFTIRFSEQEQHEAVAVARELPAALPAE
ncbi:MAG TPA: MFS transporter [Polyangiaceae bacterium]|nr:MFS transporter [Polyangiaceae bacterium]